MLCSCTSPTVGIRFTHKLLLSSTFTWLIVIDRLLQRFHAEHDTYHADIFDLNPETQKKHLSEKKIDVGIVRFADALNIYPYQSV